MWWMVVSDAIACSCASIATAAQYARIPTSGSFDVPTNVVVRTVGAVEAPMEVGLALVGGVDWPFSLDEEHEPVRITSLRFDEELPEHTTVELFIEGASSPFLTFSTGAWRDSGPPEWDGSYQAESDRRTLGTCGRSFAHSITLEGVVDDAPVQDLVALGVPRDSTLPPLVGSGERLSTYHSETCGGDETLAENFHRSYDLFVFDAAGHVAAPSRVATGCTTTPRTGPSGAALLAAVALLVRRSRSGSRRGSCYTRVSSTQTPRGLADTPYTR